MRSSSGASNAGACASARCRLIGSRPTLANRREAEGGSGVPGRRETESLSTTVTYLTCDAHYVSSNDVGQYLKGTCPADEPATEEAT
ncbi:hypothetical protein GCM10010403_23750 [Glycomyces rutgersensis]|uniref:Uncharacterized protein n=1 Tax=Glycomyces rutgersensis TaxID=58115 RepID=A0ABN3FJ60_9ACTN